MVADPAAARLPKGVRTLLRKLSDRHPTAIVSGRSVEKLHDSWVQMPSTLFDDSTPSSRLGDAGAQAAPTHPGRRLGTSEACGGLGSPPQVAPKLRIPHFQPPGTSSPSSTTC